MTDPFRADAFGETVTEKHPIPRSIHANANERRRVDGRARTGTTIGFAPAFAAPAPTNAHATMRPRPDSKDVRNAATPAPQTRAIRAAFVNPIAKKRRCARTNA